MANYEITAQLTIDTSKAIKALDSAVSEIKNMKNQLSSTANTTNNSAKANDNLSKSVKGLKDNFSYLSSGINEHNKKNREAFKNLKTLHNQLVKNNVSVKKYHKSMSKFAVDNGFIYRNGVMTDSLKDMRIETKALTNVTPNLNNAMEEMKNTHEGLRKSLSEGNMSLSSFNKKVNEVRASISSKYGVSIKNVGNATFTFRENITEAGNACKNFNKVLADMNRKLERGTFKTLDLNTYREARNELALNTMGLEKYNEVRGKTGVGLRKLNIYINENSKALGINTNELDKFNKLSTKNLAIRNRLGGSLISLSNGTGTYNKMLTTVTRSQRMQNYAMQVAALRYNALGTTLGFVGGMLGTQLVMGFAEARIESIRFEQQAQQMFKTSKLNTKEIDSLTVAVEKYTKANRKLNTAGLKYTIAQVAKMNNLTGKEAEKSIPVIADITNMMTLNGRSQEEAVLAVNDALDGQFRRLQEIGVSGKDMLKDYGWNGESGTTEGTKTMLEALEKIGKKKGWSDLTHDVTTLDDAYKVLGNTIDSFLTPVVTSMTPPIVRTIEVFSELLGQLGKAPLLIQGVAASIVILGTAFGKMKIEMLKARILGSEFMARLTGLDDGMYGITQSMGAVKLAVEDGSISFEQGTRALMNHHQKTVRASMTYDEATKKLNELMEAELAYTSALKGMSGEEAIAAQNAISNIQAEYREIYTIRQLDQQYAKYKLSMAGANGETKIMLNNIQRLLGASDAEMVHLVTSTSLLNQATGEIEIFDKFTGELNKDLQKLGLTSEQVNSIWASVKSSNNTGLTGALFNNSKKSKELEKNLLGLNKTLKLNTDTTFNNSVAQKTAAKLRKLGVDAAEAEKIAIGAVNAIEEENIGINEVSAMSWQKKNFAEKVDTLALKANTTAQKINTMQTKIGSRGLTAYIKNLKTSIVATWESVKALAAQAAAYAIADPIGTAIAIGAIATAIALCNSLIQEQIGLQSSLSKYNNLLSEGRDKLDKLDKKLESTKKNTKEYNDLLARRNALEKEYNKALALNERSEESYDAGKGRISESAEDLKKKYKSKYGEDFDFSELSSAEKEIDSLSNYQTRFSLTAKQRNDELMKLMENAHKSPQEMKKFSESYLQHQQDVMDSAEKMKSDDFMTRIGGYWDNWWAHLAMNWDEFWAGFDTNLSTSFADSPIGQWWAGFGDWCSSTEKWVNDSLTSIGKSWDDFWQPIVDFLNGTTISNWEFPNPFEMLNDWINSTTTDASEWLNDIIPSVDDVKAAIRTNIIEPFQEWFNNPFGETTESSNNSSNFMLKSIGLDENTKAIIEEKLKSLVDTITYWLNPANWVIEDGNAINNWWNTNVADPLDDKLALLGIDLHIGGSEAGGELKSGLKQGSNGSSTAVSNNLDPISGIIGKFGGIFGSKANTAGGNVKSGLKTGSKGASGPVKDEMDYINSIMNGYGGIGGSFFRTAAGVAGAIISGIKSGLNQHSPGDASKVVLREMEYTTAFMEEQKPIIEESARSIGQSIVTGMSDVSSLNTNMDMSTLLEQAKYIADTQFATETLKSQVTTNNNAIMSSNSQMGSNTKNEYGQIQQTVDSSFTDMSNTAKTSLLGIAQMNNVQMSKIKNDTNTGMNNAHTTMNTKLKGMQNTTLVATNSMTKAWGSMKNSIVKSASDIRNQSYSKFNSLHKSISSFYRQIQNASFSFGSLAAGSPISGNRSVRHTPITSNSGSGFKGFSSNIKRFGTASLADDEDYLKIMKNVLNGRAKRSDIEALYKKDYFNRDGYYFGGIDTNAHVNKQLGYAYDWRMKSPSMYGISLGMNDMTVGDFRNGKTSPFTYSNFEHYLTMLLSARGFRNPSSYDFYWNSQKSNQQVWDSVSCNCCDGAELIVEIAKDMGLNNATTIHGHWGSLGHVGAKVGGKVYDMTQFQHRGIFRGHPSVSWGGSYNGNPALLGAGKPNKGKPIRWGSVRKSYGSGGNTTNNKRSINITVTGNTFIGENDYKNKIRQISESAAEEVFYKMNSPNSAVGY